MPVQVTIASGFPKGDKLEFITRKSNRTRSQPDLGFPADWSVAKWDGKKLGKKVDKLEKCLWSSRAKAESGTEHHLFGEKADFLAQSSTSLTAPWWPMKSAKGEVAALIQSLPIRSWIIVFIFGPEGGLPLQKLKVLQLKEQSVGRAWASYPYERKRPPLTPQCREAVTE